MKRFILILGLLCLMVLPLQAQANRGILSETFARRFEERGRNPAVILAFGTQHRYIKLFKKTCIIDGVEYKLVHATVSPLGRVWRVNMIYVK